MAAPNRKTRPGLSFAFPASVYNDLIDTIRWVKQQKALTSGGQKGVSKSETVSMLKNTIPEDLPRGSILQLGDRLLDDQDFENLLGLAGIKVEDQDDLKPVGIFLEPCPADKQAPAAIAGAAIAIVNVRDTDHRFAEPVENETKLRTVEEGGAFELLEAPEATGDQNVLVRFARPQETTEGLFSITLYQTGGADGGATTQATWTYDVFRRSTGDLIESDVDPTAAPHNWGGRPNVGVCRKATTGIAELNDDGDLVVLYCDEVVTREVC